VLKISVIPRIRKTLLIYPVRRLPLLSLPHFNNLLEIFMVIYIYKEKRLWTVTSTQCVLLGGLRTSDIDHLFPVTNIALLLFCSLWKKGLRLYVIRERPLQEFRRTTKGLCDAVCSVTDICPNTDIRLSVFVGSHGHCGQTPLQSSTTSR